MRWFDGALLVLAAVAITIIVFRDGGWSLVWAGVREGGNIFLTFLPIFLLAFFIVGESQVFMNRRLDEVKEWVSGGKGIFLAWIGGMVTPSSMALYPTLRDLWERERVGLSFTVTLVLSFALLNWQTILFRVPLLGWSITGLLYLSSFFLPLLIGGIFLLLERFFR